MHFKNKKSEIIIITVEELRIELGSDNRNKKITIDKTIITMASTVKDLDQSCSTYIPATTVPKILPTDVCEFHKPNMRPLKCNNKFFIKLNNNVKLK